MLDQLFGSDYPTWSGRRQRLVSDRPERRRRRTTRGHGSKRSQAEQRLKSAEARAIQQVRDAAWKIEMNAKRIETTRAARELAEQRLDAERKRFEVGMSTSFLVIQAQRDLAQARRTSSARCWRTICRWSTSKRCRRRARRAVGDGDRVGPGRGRGPDGVGARRSPCLPPRRAPARHARIANLPGFPQQ